jgi:hypothetical protein
VGGEGEGLSGMMFECVLRLALQFTFRQHDCHGAYIFPSLSSYKAKQIKVCRSSSYSLDGDYSFVIVEIPVGIVC